MFAREQRSLPIWCAEAPCPQGVAVLFSVNYNNTYEAPGRKTMLTSRYRRVARLVTANTLQTGETFISNRLPTQITQDIEMDIWSRVPGKRPLLT